MNILIVDDSETSRLLLQTILKASGYEDLICVNSANAALEYVRSHVNQYNEPEVDLILMDLNMPDINGLQAIELFKADPLFSDIPIIMVTVSDDEENLHKAFEAGAMDYINKPVSRLELQARVRSVLRLKQEIDSRKVRERELEALTKRLKQLSNQDGLTGVPNRRYLEGAFSSEWRRSLREMRSLAFLMIDIDFFKAYNDTYGHVEGDKCLILVARAIRQCLRRPGDCMARYGGEEFAVLLPNTDVEGALKIASDIHAQVLMLGLHHSSSTVASQVTVSIGVDALRPTPDLAPATLIESADSALYAAKRAGRNRIECARKE